jgi:poly(A) polymerase
MTRSTVKLPSLARAPWLIEPRLQAVLAVLNTGGETRVAGGAVRNALMGLPIRDVDLATTLEPRDVIQLARGAGFGVHPTGIEHGTVTVVNRAAGFEVTTLRHDVETDGRRAVVAFTKEFADDAARRDFTVNALYCSPKGEIYDYTNGYSDILKKKVKFVGVPAARIKEDYLRILRFFRFHAAYGKGKPDAAGLAACKRLRAGLDGISAERKRQELLKLLVAPRAAETLKAMAASGVLKQLFRHTDNWRVLGRLPQDAILRLNALAKEPAALKEKLRLSNDEASRLEALAAAPVISPALREMEQRALLYRLGPTCFADAARLSFAHSRAAVGDRKWARLFKLPARWQAPRFPLSGKDLLDQGMASGPRLGQALQQAEDYWVAGDFAATKAELLTYIESTIA